jgi:hypothetical protein
MALLVVAGNVQADGGRVRSYLGSTAAAAETPEARAFLSELALELDRLAEAPPQRYCGTPLSQWLSEKVDLLTPAGREVLTATLAAPAQRPVLDTFFDAGTFRIHYSPDSVLNGTTDTATDGVPTYVHVAADALVRSWELLVDSIGFDLPLTDGTAGGGVDLYDCYLWSPPIFGVIGYTEPESFFGRVIGSDTVFVATSFQVVHPTMAPFTQLPDPLDLLRITCAHEFFHAFHFSYDYEEKPPWQRNGWWLEGNAVWFEDYAYPDINDWSNLPAYQNEPERSITNSTTLLDLHPYGGGSMWNFFLVERFDTVGVLREIWTGCGLVSGDNTLSVTDGLLQSNYGVTLDEAWHEFSSWSMRTGSRWDDSSFSQGAGWPTPRPITTFFQYPQATHFTTGTDNLDQLIDPSIPVYDVTAAQRPLAALGFAAVGHLPFPSPRPDSATRFYTATVPSLPVQFLAMGLDTSGATPRVSLTPVPAGDTTLLADWLRVDTMFLVASAGLYYDTGSTSANPPAGLTPAIIVALDSAQSPARSITFNTPYPNPVNVGAGESVEFTVALNEQATVYLDIFTLAGDRILSLATDGDVWPPATFTWNGRNQAGNAVAGGLYICKLTAVTEASGVAAEKVFRVGVIR